MLTVASAHPAAAGHGLPSGALASAPYDFVNASPELRATPLAAPALDAARAPVPTVPQVTVAAPGQATALGTVVRASWYGPGFYGNRTACGQTMSTTLQGVAHRSLPCGAAVTLAHGGATVTVPVVDRGPFVSGREFDLTYATKIALGCPDICSLSWLR